MKITHSSGKAYDVNPGTSIEIERANPFFNDYGEQSLPVTLPPTERNFDILQHPQHLNSAVKQLQHDATVQHGVFSIKARQAVLNSNRKTGIETSFYLNTGAFYAKIKDVELSTVFETKEVVFPSVADAITFVRNLMVTYDARFACFPVYTTGNKILNDLGAKQADGYYSLYNAESRTEVVDEATIKLDPGFYITPFIRAVHLLKEVFAYFGYTLADSFLTTTSPFKDMVFLNNNIDTVVTGKIKYSQLVPNCSVNDLLEVYRVKFCCEFVSDEVNKVISIVVFNDIASSVASTDITPMLVGAPTINHPEAFRQLKLSATRVETDTELANARPNRSGNKYEYSDAEFDSLAALFKKFPDVELNLVNGALTRVGFKGSAKITQNVGYIFGSYIDSGTFEVVEKTAPDVSPLMYHFVGGSGPRQLPSSMAPFIGKVRALNSSLALDGQEETISEEETDLKPMLCFESRSATRGGSLGTILNYDENKAKLWNYTLANNGIGGLYETFWRKYDDMLRNSMLEVSAELLLSDSDKVSLSEYDKVIASGEELLPNVIRYSPNQLVPMECTFLTTRLRTPVVSAITEAERFANALPAYKWEVNSSRTPSGYTYFAYVEEPATIFYAPPTAAEYAAGGQYHTRTYAVKLSNRTTSTGLEDPVDGTMTIWLTPALNA